MAEHGLTPDSLTAATGDGKLLTIPFSDGPVTSSSPVQAEASTANVRAKTLFLLDRFAVSDEFYHELAQANKLLTLMCMCAHH